MSITLRDQLIASCWVAAHVQQPEPDPRGAHFPVQVWGVIEDPRFTPVVAGRFADVVSWWPSSRCWTVSHQCRADDEVVELPVRVIAWQELPPVPLDWP